MIEGSLPVIVPIENEKFPFIKDFWIYKPSGRKDDFYNVYPDGYTDIIFKISKDGNIYHASRPQLLGLLTKPKSFSSMGSEIIAGIRIKPSTAFNIFDVKEEPLMHDKSIRLKNTYRASFESNKPSLNLSILDFLNQFAIQYIPQDPIASPVSFAIDQILQKNGDLDIKNLSFQTGYSLRHFERKFQTVVGLDPKKYASMVRFRTALQLIKHTDSSLLQIAFESGYYDHSHLTKEVKKLSLHTPSQIRSNNVDFLQSLNLDLQLCSE